MGRALQVIDVVSEYDECQSAKGVHSYIQMEYEEVEQEYRSGMRRAYVGLLLVHAD